MEASPKRALNASVAVTLFFVASSASAPKPRPGLGTAATPEQTRGWDIDVRPDGAGLPPGKGTVEQGEKVYAEQCAACHGEKGQNPAQGFDRLVGGKGTLATSKPVQTV